MELQGPWMGPLSKPKPGLLIILVYILSTVKGYGAIPPTVRVLVEREPAHVKVEGVDLILREATTKKLVASLDNRTRLNFQCDAWGRIHWVATPQKLQKGSLTTGQSSAPLTIESEGGFLRVNGHQYRETLYLYSLRRDCMVVNHVDLEKYVAGLLNSEMSSSWNLETLKAQAVAARTYALYQMQDGQNSFDLDSTEKDQVYEGAHKERYQAMRAVAETQGEILAYEGKPIKAFYHSTCGGFTVEPQKVWGVRVPYMRGVPCGQCILSPRYRWTQTLPFETVERALKGKHLITGSLKALRGLRHSDNEKLSEVEVVEERLAPEGIAYLRSFRVSSVTLREALGRGVLKSSDFNLDRHGRDLIFAGRGSGHGVGMCQWGAKRLGDHGSRYAAILKKYYPKTELKKIY